MSLAHRSSHPPLCSVRRGLPRLGAWALSYLLPASCAGCERRLGIDQRQGICLDCWRALEPRLWPACPRCAVPLPEGSGLCTPCQRHPPAYHWAQSVWPYEPPARGAVLAFKYGAVPGLARPLSQALLASAGERLAGLRPLLIPVPLHRVRLRQRGFDACARLARLVGGSLGLKVAQALGRPRGTIPQEGLGRLERKRNAAGSFHLLWPEAIHGRNVVLLDDVLTTGATAGVCASLLAGAGAREVGVLTLARARLNTL